MHASRSGVTAAALAAICCLLLASGAQPKRAGGSHGKAGKVKGITLLPSEPKATDTLTVSFTAGTIPRDQRYDVQVGSSGGGEACSQGYALRVRGIKRRGQRVSVTFDASDHRAYPTSSARATSGRFCAGSGRIYVSRADAEGNLKLAGERAFKIAKDPSYPEPLGVPAKITLLDGSSLLVQAPGRPDRTLGLAGLMRGAIPEDFRPNTDVQIGSMLGQLWLRSFTSDAACASPSVVTEFGLTSKGPSNLLLKASGEGVLSLVLAVDPAALAGCAAPASGSTPLTLTSTVGPDGLQAMTFLGSVTGVPVGGGVTATVAVKLRVSVDLSGQG